MKFLFIHQGFPGQYVHIIDKLAEDKDNIIVGMGLNAYKPRNSNVTYVKYGLQKGNAAGIHEWILDIESKVIRGEACADAAEKLKNKGFEPNVICGHPGWGEMLFLKKIWPEVPMIQYQEFYYNEENSDSDFDPEFQSERTWKDKARTIMKAVNAQLNLRQTDWNITPTKFQKSTFPEIYQKKISVIHDGINIDEAKPNSARKIISLAEGKVINPGDTVITFVNRKLEPYRGCHTFIRAIPLIQEKVKGCKIIMIGEKEGVSYGAKCKTGEWYEKFFAEIKGKYIEEDVHLIGSVDHSSFTKIIQRSDVHVYLTYPFVLSWSLLEAMACEIAIVGSKTEPVMELISHNKNGLLVDFFDKKELSEGIKELAKNKDLAKKLGKEARQTIVNNYSQKECVEKQIALIKMVADRIIS